MITVPELAAEALGSYLAEHMDRRLGSTEARLTELIPSAARLAIDCIGNSDALYHNVEHTMLVTLVGYDIVRGRALPMPGAVGVTAKAAYRVLSLCRAANPISRSRTGSRSPFLAAAMMRRAMTS